MESNQLFFERRFLLSHHKTDVKTEFMAGSTTFMVMSYILIINPDLLSRTDMNKGGVFMTTILVSIVTMPLMELYVSMLLALPTGMRLNAFLTYTVCLGMGYERSFALTAVFLEGIILILLSFFNTREAILTAVSHSLKKAVSVGIGLSIVLISFTSSGLIAISEATYLATGNLLIKESFIAIVALFTMAILTAKRAWRALPYGVTISTVLVLITGVTRFPDVASLFSLPPSIKDVVFHLEWDNISTFDMFSIMSTFLSVGIFDTIGTLTGVTTKADLINENRDLPDASKALLSDAIEAICGALLGASTATTFIEFASGVADGGRAGLTSLSAAFFFFISLFLFPLSSIVPPQTTATTLIMVGLFMMSLTTEIDLSDYTESVPAFLTIVMMSFAYSIAEGISVGMIFYVIMKVVTDRAKEVSVMMHILALISSLRYLSPFVF